MSPRGGKWEEIWSIWWHYKACSFIKTRSRLASSFHTCSGSSEFSSATTHILKTEILSKAKVNDTCIILLIIRFIDLNDTQVCAVLVAPDMRILGHAAFFLLLGSICCKNNRHAKSGGKSSRKSGENQGADVSQSPLVDAAAGSTGRGNGGSAEAGRDSAAAARKAGQQTDDMRLHFLKNNQVTCNDGTAAGWDVPDFASSLTSVDATRVVPYCRLYMALQVLPEGVKRKSPMAGFSGRWEFLTLLVDLVLDGQLDQVWQTHWSFGRSHEQCFPLYLLVRVF